MSKMKTIQVTIDEDLLQKLDQAIADLQTTRSTFLHLALKKALRKHHIRQLEELDEVGYTAVPATASDVEEWETEQGEAAMKTLLILRHAKSDWGNSKLSDHDRPLNDRGKDDAPRMGAWLRQQDMVPELIISSTAERALTTAEMVALACDFEGELRPTRDFYLAGPPEYIEVLNELPDSYERVMIVGHNPGMEELVALLTDQERPFTTANVAVVELPIASWGELSIFSDGRLKHHWRPKDLPA